MSFMTLHPHLYMKLPKIVSKLRASKVLRQGKMSIQGDIWI